VRNCRSSIDNDVDGRLCGFEFVEASPCDGHLDFDTSIWRGLFVGRKHEQAAGPHYDPEFLIAFCVRING
jgi:hypothetical protein